MATEKIAITVDKGMVQELDRLVRQGIFGNRSKAIQEAVRDRLDKIRTNRLASEVLKLDPEEERRMAEESFKGEEKLWRKS